MKVVVIASLAYSLVNFRGRLLAAMVENGHDVIACAPDSDPEIEDRLRSMGVAYRRMPMARTGMNPLTDIVTLLWLIGFLLRNRPQLVLAYTQKPIIYGGIASRLVGGTRFFAMVSGLGHVFSESGSRLLPLIRRIVSTLYRFALRRAAAVFVFNSDDEEEMRRHHILQSGTRVIQVPGSGVDLSHYAQQPVPDGPPIFLMIARLLRNKGLLEFVEAARIVRALYPQVRCRLLGPLDANPAAVSRATIEAWQAEGVIEYCGETRDVRPHLAAASVFVLPSWYREGLPRTLLEAMSVGRAVITTDMPGCREPVEEGRNGYLVPARDGAALAQAMLHFARDPGLAAAMGAAARRTAEDRFAVERVNHLLLTTMNLNAGDPQAQDRRSPAMMRPGMLQEEAPCP
ncbi:glycosyltransferase family 1 protein [Sphingobium sp. SCG-1]|uniref:glycosyltransferase family 4 protein n=1 Tax=Sphingobium sp. SCG-1 TaxID=2072936 RepID=UPI000CD68E03|nr:glycosyltransferase family 4 protein [Sphingobium sp. SCG-1]AUW57377.1 glycosyltransferase family 1 protein [Sphingobium sp. SCG-1]